MKTMSNAVMPRYPIYIPSKGRHAKCLTAKFLRDDSVPFHIVVEPHEHDAYAHEFGEDYILTLPWDNPGSVIPARNWIKEHATAAGYERHWQIDDNCRCIYRVWAGRRLRCNAGVALAATEDFTDRYENVAVSGLNYAMFVAGEAITVGNGVIPFRTNCHVYSCTLTLNTTPHCWRGRYNEDTDYCLQVLADGWCIIQINAFVINKMATMTMHGGNTSELYQGDGRLKMARELERRWPGVVKVKRRFGRPQHVVDWTKFKTPLRRKVDLDLLPAINEYGLTLKRTNRPSIKGKRA
jgi:hypothetical protein